MAELRTQCEGTERSNDGRGGPPFMTGYSVLDKVSRAKVSEDTCESRARPYAYPNHLVPGQRASQTSEYHPSGSYSIRTQQLLFSHIHSIVKTIDAMVHPRKIGQMDSYTLVSCYQISHSGISNP